MLISSMFIVHTVLVVRKVTDNMMVTIMSKKQKQYDGKMMLNTISKKKMVLNKFALTSPAAGI